MKNLIVIIGAVCIPILFTGCISGTTAGPNSTLIPIQNLITPTTLNIVAENGTYAALEKQPQLLPALEATVTGITNATAGGTLTINAATLTSTLNQLGFGGLANQPGAPLLMDDLSFAAAQFDAQQGTNSLSSNTNIVPALNAIASGMQRGIQIFKQ